MVHHCPATVPRPRPRRAGRRLEKPGRHRRHQVEASQLVAQLDRCLTGRDSLPWRHRCSAPGHPVELALELVSPAVDGEEELAEELSVSLLPDG
jgi:hypothetical protein